MNMITQMKSAGYRKDLYIWALETEALVKVISAHFQRILDVIPLSSGRDDCVISSSLDRSIKVSLVITSTMMVIKVSEVIHSRMMAINVSF